MSSKYEFIDAEYATPSIVIDGKHLTIVQMCEWLGVSRSGFYEWRSRPESATARRREELKAWVTFFFTASDETYGYRRIHADLADEGIAAGPELVRSLMRELGLQPCQPKPWRASLTEPDGLEHHIPDLVQRDFTADAPGRKLVGDVTYIETWEGWTYLATVIDCHTKAVIGWAIDDNYRTPLIEQAIKMAARNHKLAKGAIFHSDRGSNGGFNWLSQHHWWRRVLWRREGLVRRSRRVVGRCGHRGGRRSTGVRSSSGSGGRSPRG